jgi:predicted nucleotide-binding protein
MARSPPQKPSAKLTPEQMRAAVPRLEARIKELNELNVSEVNRGDDPPVDGLSARISSTLASIYGENTIEYERLNIAAELDSTTYSMSVNPFGGYTPTPVSEVREGVDRGRRRAVSVLQGEVDSLKEVLQYSAAPSPSPKEPELTATDEIFIVHGRDSAAKAEVARFIQQAGLKPVILHEQPNAGRTVIEKFEQYGESAGFAVILLTPDDVGGPDAEHLQPRARQNVVGEMFWFAGKAGRERVCALKKGHIEIASDFAGVVYTDMDDRGAWKTELLKELRAAGYSVDWEKALAS